MTSGRCAQPILKMEEDGTTMGTNKVDSQESQDGCPIPQSSERNSEHFVPADFAGGQASNDVGDMKDDLTGKDNISENPSSSSSTASNGTVCRICQDGNEEGNELVSLGCSCRGSIRMVHETCLLEWITSQRSVICELCHTPFAGVNLDQLLQYERMHGITRGTMSITSSEEDLMVSPPYCYNARRFWIMCIVVMMALSLSSSFVQTVIISREYHSVQERNDDNDWSTLETSPTPQYGPQPPGQSGDEVGDQDELTDARFSYLMSLTVLALTALVTIGAILLWVVAECCVWPLEKFVEDQIRMVTRQQERNAFINQFNN